MRAGFPADGLALLEATGLPAATACMPLSGGYANDLYRLTLTGPPHSAVLRRWRRDPSRAATELAVMRRAAGVVAVPEVLASDLSGSHPLALLQDVPGLNAQEALHLHPGEAEQIGEVLGETFARLNRVKFERAGFFGGPDLQVQPWPESTPARQLLDYAEPLIGNEVARAALGAETAVQLWALICQHAPLLDGLAGEAHLVHADANPKNVMVQRTPEGWRLGAVLDWEFAFSGSSLTDLGNLLRFEPREGSAHSAGVVRGWRAGGGSTQPHFLALARILDLYSLLEFVNRPEAALHPAVVRLIQENTALGRL